MSGMMRQTLAALALAVCAAGCGPSTPAPAVTTASPAPDLDQGARQYASVVAQYAGPIRDAARQIAQCYSLVLGGESCAHLPDVMTTAVAGLNGSLTPGAYPAPPAVVSLVGATAQTCHATIVTMEAWVINTDFTGVQAAAQAMVGQLDAWAPYGVPTG